MSATVISGGVSPRNHGRPRPRQCVAPVHTGACTSRRLVPGDGHGRRQRRLRDGRHRAAISGRLCRTVLRERGLRTHGDCRRHRGASASTCLLPQLCGSHDRGTCEAGIAPDCNGARQHAKSFFRFVRLRRQRDPGEDRLVLQQSARQAAQEEDHFARTWLPRLLRNLWFHDRIEVLSRPHGFAVSVDSPHRCAAPLLGLSTRRVRGRLFKTPSHGIGCPDHARGARHGRRLYCRAGAGNRRVDSATEALLGVDTRSLEASRCADDRR